MPSESRPAHSLPQPATEPAEGMARSTADDWQEEATRQARALRQAPADAAGPHPFSEFRRKLAAGEMLSRSAEKLAGAVEFSGRITLTFHQGKLTKTVMEESYFRGRAAM